MGHVREVKGHESCVSLKLSRTHKLDSVHSNNDESYLCVSVCNKQSEVLLMGGRGDCWLCDEAQLFQTHQRNQRTIQESHPTPGGTDELVSSSVPMETML